MRERDPTAKALIFTQFNSTLQWLMDRLTAEGYGYRTISGGMTLRKRTQVGPACQAMQLDTCMFFACVRLKIPS